MTHEELDAMWSIATRKSIEENQPYTRYEFAKMVAAKEREACATACESMADRFMQGSPLEGNKPYASHECAKAIRARGEA